MGEKTSTGFATHALSEIINQLSDSHEVLKYIKIDETNYEQGTNAFNISPEINNSDSYLLGKAIRDILKMTGHNLGNKTHNFIEYFKIEMGEDYINEIEKIVVNLHFLELKFA